MFKFSYAAPGTAPGATTVELRPRDPQALPPALRLIQYDVHGVQSREIASIAELPAHFEDGRVHWVEMCGIHDLEMLRALGEKFGLHPLALEDVLHTGQRPKIEAYDQHLFLISQMIYKDAAGQLTAEQVSIFLFHNVLISIQEEPTRDCFDPVRERIRSGRGSIRKFQSDYLAYALLDAIIDHCFPVLEDLGESIEELENILLDNPGKDCVGTLHNHRRTLMQLRRLVWPQRDVISTLLHDESGLIAPTTRVFLRDCYDHTIQIMDLIESYRDVTAGLFEMYLSAVSMRTNEIMRVLTVVTSLFIPLTFIAGVYGMNFDFADGKMPLNMPELHHRFGYVGCLLVMGLIAVAQLVFFRRKNWI